jgi:hypothetical protein
MFPATRESVGTCGVADGCESCPLVEELRVWAFGQAVVGTSTEEHT